jgi:type I restriction enzyme, S subunit
MSWPIVKLGDVMTIGRGSSPRPIKDDRFFTGGAIPWVKIADATASGKFIHKTNQHVNEYGASFSRKLKPGSLIFPASGTLGIPRFLGVEACIHDGWLYFSEYRGISPDWLYYRIILLKDYYEGIAYGAAIQNINTDIVRNTEIRLPDLATQQRISVVLCAYDDLIAVNQRRITLLEDAARRLYREWFVHLRFPGHESEPMTNGLPGSWVSLTLGEVCEAVGGGTPSTARPEYWGGEVVWVTPTDVTRNDCLALLDSEKKISEAGLANSSAKLVPPETILMTSRASIGFFALMDMPVCTNQGFISVLPKQSNSRMYLLFNLLERVDEMIGLATGSTFKELSKKTFRALPVLWPTNEPLELFEGKVYPLIQQVRLLKQQNKQLAQARDLLLPKLMSGQLDVSSIRLPDETTA